MYLQSFFPKSWTVVCYAFCHAYELVERRHAIGCGVVQASKTFSLTGRALMKDVVEAGPFQRIKACLAAICLIRLYDPATDHSSHNIWNMYLLASRQLQYPFPNATSCMKWGWEIKLTKCWTLSTGRIGVHIPVSSSVVSFSLLMTAYFRAASILNFCKLRECFKQCFFCIVTCKQR